MYEIIIVTLKKKRKQNKLDSEGCLSIIYKVINVLRKDRIRILKIE
jgi:hypothetical protein